MSVAAHGAVPERAIASTLRAANPVRVAHRLWSDRDLIGQLTWREITGRYRSSTLGVVWSFVTPMVNLALYTFVFGVVFTARWPGAHTNSLAEYGLMLFAGLTAFAVFSECVTRAPSLIAASPNYVKKVVFPLDVLPVSIAGAALFHAGISVLLLTVARLVVMGAIAPTVALVPIVLLPLVALALGCSWVLASLGVYVRDMAHAVALATQVLFFTTPIFYPLDAIPAAYQPIIAANPLTSIVQNMRNVAVAGSAPDWQAWTVSMAIGLLVLWAGHTWFARTRAGFADVL